MVLPLFLTLEEGHPLGVGWGSGGHGGSKEAPHYSCPRGLSYLLDMCSMALEECIPPLHVRPLREGSILLPGFHWACIPGSGIVSKWYWVGGWGDDGLGGGGLLVAILYPCY